ncbi:antibiotic biosynthesis monooxygenase family protein [Kineosporia babensis]|uniref:Antibiotic biosynthesis monooxygenase n=1 Tax=Kineosporia babensis TaxID=499548 RepID=A0A9X1NMM4_9ACTN|nr:antibiotic biosynthesis monooxygenase family protein [Kineosporia babensis]MCD5316531.1 antibiotic biosynthesis monooxygenase [Kineosporia babensis]
MLIQQVQVAITPGQQTRFETALLEVRRLAFQAPGFRRFDVAQGADQPTQYQIQVFWETAEELGDYVTSDAFEQTWAPVHPFLTRPLLINVFLERPSLDFQGPGVLPDVVGY